MNMACKSMVASQATIVISCHTGARIATCGHKGLREEVELALGAKRVDVILK